MVEIVVTVNVQLCNFNNIYIVEVTRDFSLEKIWLKLEKQIFLTKLVQLFKSALCKVPYNRSANKDNRLLTWVKFLQYVKASTLIFLMKPQRNDRISSKGS